MFRKARRTRPEPRWRKYALTIERLEDRITPSTLFDFFGNPTEPPDGIVPPSDMGGGDTSGGSDGGTGSSPGTAQDSGSNSSDTDVWSYINSDANGLAAAEQSFGLPINSTTFLNMVDRLDLLFAGNTQQGSRTDEVILLNTNAVNSEYAVVVMQPLTGTEYLRYRHPNGAFASWTDATDRTFVADIDNDGVVEFVQVNRPASWTDAITGGFIRIVDVNSGIVRKVIQYQDTIGDSTYAQVVGGLVDPEDGAYIGHFTRKDHVELLLFNRTNQERDRIALRAIDLVTGEVTFTSFHDGTIFGGWIDYSDESFVLDTNNDGYDDLVLVNRVPDPSSYRPTNIGFIGIVSIHDIPGTPNGPYRGFYRFFDWNYARPGENSVFPGYDDLYDRALGAVVINNGRRQPVIVLVNSSSTSQAAYAVLEPRPLTPGVRDSFQLITTVFHHSSNLGYFTPDNRFVVGDFDGDGSQELASLNAAAAAPEDYIRVFKLFGGPTGNDMPPGSGGPTGLDLTAENTRWVIFLQPGISSPALASVLGAQHERETGHIPNTYYWQFPAGLSLQDIESRLKSRPEITDFYRLVPLPIEKRLFPNDPLFSRQWHLLNVGQVGGFVGEDINVTPAWDQATGAGVDIAIVDDALQWQHPDLFAHYKPLLSWDFNDVDGDPSPTSATEGHGTNVAGVAAAVGNNFLGVTGVAFNAGLAGLRILGGPVTDQISADALAFKNNEIEIYINSWGPPDTGDLLQGPGPLTAAALANGATRGRNGLGTIYVWAAGNGRQKLDNANYDGFANSRYTIAVAALGPLGRFASYSEPGANIFVSAYGGDGNTFITTTDLVGEDGDNATDYTDQFSGTSAAAPQVAGVIALMLQANPNLTYRDVQHILARTARKNDPSDPGWVTNGGGFHVNHNYGFGVVDADAAVELAKNWQPLPAQTGFSSGLMPVSVTIPDNDPVGVSRSVNVPANFVVERVFVTFSATHTFRGHLRIVLTSPSGTRSILAEPHIDANDNYPGWTFSSIQHWGESAQGTWILTVSDELPADVGTWDSWQLEVVGFVPQQPGGGGGGGSGGGGAGPGVGGEPDRFERNNTSDRASDLGVFASLFLDQLTVHSNTDRDWYRFRVESPGQLTIRMQLAPDAGDLDMRLFTLSPDNTLILLRSSTTRQAGASEVITWDVTPDSVLLLWVYGFNQNMGRYTLDFSVA